MAKTGSKTSRKREKSLKHQTLPRSNTITQMHSGDGWMNMPHNRPHSMRFKRTTSFGDTRSLGTVPLNLNRLLIGRILIGQNGDQ